MVANHYKPTMVFDPDDPLKLMIVRDMWLTVTGFDAPCVHTMYVDMGNEQLRIIAHELLEQVRNNVTVDWHKKESARAKMRVLVRRILKRFGYPPDLSQEAVQVVLEQAEALLREIA